jgi:uncharacterized membrane protein
MIKWEECRQVTVAYASKPLRLRHKTSKQLINIQTRDLLISKINAFHYNENSVTESLL